MRTFLLRVRLWRDRSGVTAIEYAFIASLITVTIVISVGAVGNALSSTFSELANAGWPSHQGSSSGTAGNTGERYWR